MDREWQLRGGHRRTLAQPQPTQTLNISNAAQRSQFRLQELQKDQEAQSLEDMER